MGEVTEAGRDPLGDALKELVEISDELEQSDDLARRLELTERRNLIRAQWARGLGDMSIDQLHVIESNLRVRCKEIRDRLLDIGSSGNGSGDGGGIDPLLRMQHNRRVAEEFGLPDIERELLDVLAEISRQTES